jgi:hypothetical protein
VAFVDPANGQITANPFMLAVTCAGCRIAGSAGRD